MSNTYVKQFLQLKCAGDVLNAVTPVNNCYKEITEAMAIIREVKRIVFANKDIRYHLVDLCAGNALSSVLAVHLMPLASAIAIDRRIPPHRHYDIVHNFTYLQEDIMANTFCNDLNNIYSGQNFIIISTHPCGELANTIVDIYNKTNASHLVMMPCCLSSDKSFKVDIKAMEEKGIPPYVLAKLSKYDKWLWNLTMKVRGKFYRNLNCTSMANGVVVAHKTYTDEL